MTGSIWGQGGGGVVRVVGLLTVREGEMKNGESPESTTEVGISAFLDRQFPMLPR